MTANDSKPNVLQLCLSRGIGGLEMYPPQVMHQLNKRDIPCRMVVARDTYLAKRVADENLSHEFLDCRFRSAPFLAARKLARVIDDGKYDILHMHWGHDLQLAALAKCFAKRSVKLIYTRQMALTRPKFDPYHRFLYGRVDRYITITHLLEEEANRFLPMPHDHIVPLYYGVPQVAAASQEACHAFFEEHKQPEDSFHMALFGRIHPLKGQHTAVDALARMVEAGTNAYLTLFGGIMSQEYFDTLLANAQDAGVGDRLIYAGFVDNAGALMSCFDTVIMASKAETFGLVVAEAMRAGTAVVGSDSGGVPELIEDGETGFLFPEGDADALADALIRLADDPDLRQRLATAGKAFADAQFDEDQHYDRLVAIFEGCLAEPAPQ